MFTGVPFYGEIAEMRVDDGVAQGRIKNWGGWTFNDDPIPYDVAFVLPVEADSSMRHAPQLGQKPRFLQENATSRSDRQCSHTTRRKP